MGSSGTLPLGGKKIFWLGFLAAFLGGALFFSRSNPHLPQPIAFNHHAHDAAGVACADCHVGVQQQAQATLPDVSVCMMCHQNPVTQNPEEAKIRQAAEKGAPLLWQQATRVARHVYFSHRRHVTIGKLACAECHGNVTQSTAPSNMPVRAVTMQRCLDCHARNKVSNDCDECHR